MSEKQNDKPWVKVSKHCSIQSPNTKSTWQLDQQMADGAISPALTNAAVLQAASKPSIGEIDVVATVSVLQEQIAAIAKGDMSQAEAMLYSQAVALQSIFVNLSQKAMAQEFLSQYQTFMALAFKAQAQCRTTLEALNEIKFPKSATFVKQANIAQQQQVNNGSLAHAEKKADPANELLTEANHGTLDTGATEPAGQSHPTMEAVGTVHGAKNQPGQKAKRAERP